MHQVLTRGGDCRAPRWLHAGPFDVGPVAADGRAFLDSIPTIGTIDNQHLGGNTTL